MIPGRLKVTRGLPIDFESTPITDFIRMEESIVAILRTSAERNLPRLLIGGNAVILLGYIRTTADIDLMVPATMRSCWLDRMRDLGWRLYNGTSAFAQFESPEKGGTPVDLMLVDTTTWEKLSADSPEKRSADKNPEPFVLD